MIVCDGEFVCELLFNFRGFFAYVVHYCAARTARKRNVKARELRFRADGVNFHTTISQIANVSGEAQRSATSCV